MAAGRRIRLIAQHTLAEAVHLRLTFGLGLMSAVLIGAAYSLREFNFGEAELRFISDFGLGALGLGGGLLAALVTAQLFFQDLETQAIYAVLTRPGQRWEYIAGKFTGVAALLALFFPYLACCWWVCCRCARWEWVGWAFVGRYYCTLVGCSG